MKDKREDIVKQLTDKALSSSSMETPSTGFTERVMSRIEALADHSVFQYKPLISKWVWGIIGVIAVSLIIAVVIVPSGGWPEWNLPDWNFNINAAAQPLHLPGALMTGLFCFALFLMVQVWAVKRTIDKRMEM